MQLVPFGCLLFVRPKKQNVFKVSLIFCSRVCLTFKFLVLPLNARSTSSPCAHLYAAGSSRPAPVRPSKKTKRVQGLPYLLLTRLSYIQIPCTPIKPMHAVHVLHVHIYMQLVLLGRLLLFDKKKNIQVFIIFVCVLFAHTCTCLYPVYAYMYAHIRTSTFSCFISIAIFPCVCSVLSGHYSSPFPIHTGRRKQRSYRGRCQSCDQIPKEDCQRLRSRPFGLPWFLWPLHHTRRRFRRCPGYSEQGHRVSIARTAVCSQESCRAGVP